MRAVWSYLDLFHPLLVGEDGLLALAQRRRQARVELLVLPPYLLLLLPQHLLHRLAPKVLQIFDTLNGPQSVLMHLCSQKSNVEKAM